MLSNVQFLAFAERPYKDEKKGTFRVAQCLILGETEEETLVGEFWLFNKELVAEEGKIYVAEFEISRDYENRISGRLIAFHPEGSKLVLNTAKQLRIVAVQNKTAKTSNNKYQIAQCVLKDEKGVLVGVLPSYDGKLELTKGEYYVQFALGVDFNLRIVPRVASLVPIAPAVPAVPAVTPAKPKEVSKP